MYILSQNQVSCGAVIFWIRRQVTYLNWLNRDNNYEKYKHKYTNIHKNVSVSFSTENVTGRVSFIWNKTQGICIK